MSNVLDTLANIFQTGYSVYQDQRNFNYQKNLQQQLFSRDDNAMQRRIDDYKSAGINPLLALGGAAAGNSSAGGASAVPINIDNSFFTNQEREKLTRETIKDEMDKRRYEKDLLALQLKSGKIANLEALQNLNTKNLEYKILQNQLLNYEFNDYWPSSQIGKAISDISAIVNNNLPTGFSALKPMPSLFNYLSNGIEIDPDWINRLNGKGEKIVDYTNNLINGAIQKTGNIVSDVKDKANNIVTEANIKESYKNRYPHYNDLQSVWKQFNSWNKNKNLQLHFIREKGDYSPFNPRGYFMLYNKSRKSYYTPRFYNFESINRFLNYGNVKY